MPITFLPVDSASAYFLRALLVAPQHVLTITITGELHHSTDDGTTWPLVDTFPTLTGATPGDPVLVRAIWSPPGVPSMLFVWVQVSGGPNIQGGLFKSVDGGSTWTQVYVDPFSVFFTESILTIVALSPTHFLMSGALVGSPGSYDLLESTDTGDTWAAKVQAGAPAAGAPWQCLFRVSTGTLLLSTQTSADVDPQLFKSTNGGGLWAAKVVPNQVASSARQLLELADGSLLLAGTGGVWRSTDDGDTWAQALALDVPARGVAWCRELSGGVVLAVGNWLTVTNDIIWRSANFGATWAPVFALAGADAGLGSPPPGLPLPLGGGALLMTIDLQAVLAGGSEWVLSPDNGLTWSPAGVTPPASGVRDQLALDLIVTSTGGVLSVGYGAFGLNGQAWRTARPSGSPPAHFRSATAPHQAPLSVSRHAHGARG